MSTRPRPTPTPGAQRGHSPQGAAFTSLVLEVFRLNGMLVAAGNELGRGLHLTSARWQVLGAIALGNRPLTVAEIARTMGMTRQGVQRVTNDLEEAGLVQRAPHPVHRRARPVELTVQGRASYAAISRRQVPWANRCAEALTTARLETAVRSLRTLRQSVESQTKRRGTSVAARSRKGRG
jgi:DNA-binding MarR family transcriptional regulator